MTPSEELPAAGSPAPENEPLPEHVVTRSRLGTLWAAAVGFAVVLLLLLIFILENGQRADVAFFGVHAHLPLGVALLLAAVFGILLVVVPGIGRMVQLRMTARRHRQADAVGKTAEPPSASAPPTPPTAPIAPTAPVDPDTRSDSPA
jgi:lipopolysaccharide assembly protein A